jgi:hypothetical protein
VNFLYSCYLPFAKKNALIKELSFNSYKNLVKNITNNNNKSIDILLEDIVRMHVIDLPACNFLEKIIILLTIRAVCVSDKLELTLGSKNFKQDISIIDFIKKIEDIDLDNFYNKKISLNNDIDITLKIPNQLYYEDEYISFIETVFLNGSEYPVTEEILNNLPANVFIEINEFKRDLEALLSKVCLFMIKNPADLSENIEIFLSSNVQSIFDFLKFIFKRDLLSFYEIEFFLFTKMNMSLEDLDRITPAEIDIYINLFKKDLEDRNKQTKSPVDIPQP